MANSRLSDIKGLRCPFRPFRPFRPKRPTSPRRLIPFAVALLTLSPAVPASVLVGVLTHDGVVLATDSRLSRVTAAGDHQVMSDHETKLVIVQSRFLVALAGKSRLKGQTVWQHVDTLGDTLAPETSLDGFLEALAKHLSDVYHSDVPEGAQEQTITCLVAGYQDGVGKLVELMIPTGKITPLHTTDKPGMAWSGDGGIILNRLIIGVDKRVADDTSWDDEQRKRLRQREFMFPLADVTVPDAVKLARLAVQTSIDWSEQIKGTLAEPELFHPTVGGPVDIAIVTPKGASWVQRKPLYKE